MVELTDNLIGIHNPDELDSLLTSNKYYSVNGGPPDETEFPLLMYVEFLTGTRYLIYEIIDD